MKAIPTTYKGINFRSRLEARWAAFLDLLGWNWSYESIDFDGWIPDFSIQTKHKPLLVEVKPAFEFPEEAWNKARRALGDFEKYNVLFCGLGIFASQDDPACVGWHTDDFRGAGWEYAVVIDGFNKPFYYGLASGITGAYEDILTGNWDGDHDYCPIASLEIHRLWGLACNATQWHPKKRAHR